MTVRHDHWIAGRAEPPASGGYLATIDPVTRQSADEVAAGSEPDVDRAVAAAVAAQPGWAGQSGEARSTALHRIADALEAGADAVMDLEGRSTGKVPAQLRADLAIAVESFRYYAAVVRAHHGRTIDLGDGVHAYTRYEPYGVVAVITPWNFPLTQACRAIAPALAAGNAVVAKPSEFTSPSTVHLARLATEAGLPDGLLNVVTGTGQDVGSPLAEHPAVGRIAFTGSVATGRHLATIAAGRLVPMTLELGGKSPMVVFADADIDRAVAAAVRAVVMNAGQTCTATTRLLLEEAIHDEFVSRVVESLEGLEPGVDFGPMITEPQYRKVLDHFDAARAAGAVPITGGSAYDTGRAAAGLYLRPTVYARVDADLAIAREEIFGPVLVTRAFTDEADALASANDSEYGLLASVWSGDLARGLRVAEHVDAGQVTVNGGPLNMETPLGGYKQSGYGREKGVEALDEYAQVKAISVSIR